MKQSHENSAFGVLILIGLVWCAGFVAAVAQWYAINPCDGKPYGSGPMVQVFLVGLMFFTCTFAGYALGKSEG